jgi:hypothetical protein
VPRIDLLHFLGDAPEGPWAVFSLPHGDGTDLVSVVVPRTLWWQVTRSNPFASEMSLMEEVGARAIAREIAQRPDHRVSGPIFVQPEDVGASLALDDEVPWYRAMRRCPQCHREVPAGELSEGLSNALPPNSRGEIEVKVLCPSCQVQTAYRLTPWGLVRA